MKHNRPSFGKALGGKISSSLATELYRGKKQRKSDSSCSKGEL